MSLKIARVVNLKMTPRIHKKKKVVRNLASTPLLLNLQKLMTVRKMNIISHQI